MAQADYSIANQGFPATRADINSHLEAIATNNSGTSAPSTQYAGQFWIDTTTSTWTMYIHDGADDIQFATIDTSANTVNFIDSTLAYPLTNFSSTGIDDNATSTAITIDSSERVGIGTASPSRQLEIYDDGTFGQAVMAITAQNTEPSRIFFADPDDNNIGSIDYYHSDDSMSFRVNDEERMRIDSSGNLKFNSGYGSVATAYGVRAWVHFDGSAGAVSINESSDNVSSVAEVTTGAYHVNLSPNFVDGNYSAGAFCDNDAGGKIGSFVTVTATNYFRIELAKGFGGTALTGSTEVHGHAVR